MQDKFLESIKRGFISQIEEIISESSTKAKTDNLNAIDTLILINTSIEEWIKSVNVSFNVDDELLNEVAKLKIPYVTAAKKEAAQNISKIITESSGNVTEEISNYINGLKGKGIDLDNQKLNISMNKTNNDSNKSSKLENDKITSMPLVHTHQGFGLTNSDDDYDDYDDTLFGRRTFGRNSYNDETESRQKQKRKEPEYEDFYSCGGGGGGCEGGR